MQSVEIRAVSITGNSLLRKGEGSTFCCFAKSDRTTVGFVRYRSSPVNHEATINPRVLSRLVRLNEGTKSARPAVTPTQLSSPNAYFRNAPRGIRRLSIREMKSRLPNFKCCARQRGIKIYLRRARRGERRDKSENTSQSEVRSQQSAIRQGNAPDIPSLIFRRTDFH